MVMPSGRSHKSHFAIDFTRKSNVLSLWTPPAAGVYVFQPLFSDWNLEAVYKSYLSLVYSPSADGNAEEELVDTEVQDVDEANIPDTPLGEVVEFLEAGIWPQARDSINGVYAGISDFVYVDLEQPTIGIEPTLLTSAELIGPDAVKLSGPALDDVLVHDVQISIDGGPWYRAGIQENGRWSFPWASESFTDDAVFEVQARAIDIAGRMTTVTEQVTVDFESPTLSDIELTYTNAAGESFPVEAGDVLTDTIELHVHWGSATDPHGTIRYDVGFSQTDEIYPGALTSFNGPGTLSQAVGGGQQWYVTVKYVDEVNNESVVIEGPIFIKEDQ
ncbi:MAG: hypothetical protein GY850_04875 [bacterium]|nr:hypothetical protein [bacterium]